MYRRSNDRPGASPRLALRTAVLGGVAVALFAVLFFRLWDLQVLSGDAYLAEAKNNRTREFKVIAPRGDILDRDGDVLVDNRTSLALQLNTQKLPEDRAEERAELARLGKLAADVAAQGAADDPRTEEVAAGAPVTLRKDVDYDLVYYLEENQRDFPGVAVQRVFVRAYPRRHPRRARGRQRRRGHRRRAEGSRSTGTSSRATRSARTGSRTTYDRYLRGDPGLTRIQVNALGQPTPGRPARLAAADSWRQPQADDRLRRPGGRRKRPRLPRAARRLRDDERPQRRDPRRWARSRPSTRQSSPSR